MTECGLADSCKIFNFRGFTEDDRRPGIATNHLLKLEVESERNKVKAIGIWEELARHMENVDKVLKGMEECEKRAKGLGGGERRLESPD